MIKRKKKIRKYLLPLVGLKLSVYISNILAYFYDFVFSRITLYKKKNISLLELYIIPKISFHFSDTIWSMGPKGIFVLCMPLYGLLYAILE